jgi:biopolymer transport protein ExbB/biopolymer transport protein TolQ
MDSLLSPEQNGSWDLAGMVRSMGRLAQGLFILLLFMCAVWWSGFPFPLVRYIQAVFALLLFMGGWSVNVMAERFLTYKLAHKQSRTFLQQVAGALRNRDLDQAIAIAGRNNRSPIAKVAASGLASFQAAMPLFSDVEAVETAKRALMRSQAVVHGKLRRGLNTLGSIANTAPLVGAFGTVLGIMSSFPGCGASRSYCMTVECESLSEALLPTALGLLVAMLTVWCYKYLSSELEALEVEMENESLALVNYLIIYLAGRE